MIWQLVSLALLFAQADQTGSAAPAPAPAASTAPASSGAAPAPSPSPAPTAAPGDSVPAPAGGGANGGGGSGDGSGLIQFLPFLVIMGLLYFMFLRPQMQQEKKRQAMLKALSKNDKVVTSAGMYGTVVSVDEGSDRVVLKVGEDDKGLRIAFTRASIVRILGDEAEKSKEPAKS